MINMKLNLVFALVIAVVSVVATDHSSAHEWSMSRSRSRSRSQLQFPEIKSKHSLVAKHLTREIWDKLSTRVTKTTGFTLSKAIASAVAFDNQPVGIYAGDWDSYKYFAEIFDPIIQEYHGITSRSRHTTDMQVSKIRGHIYSGRVEYTRISVGRNLEGFGLSPGILKEQRVQVEALMKNAFASLTGDLAGTYYPLAGMDNATRQGLIDDHVLFTSGDKHMQVAGMERDWPEGRGIFYNNDRTFLAWVNEEDQLRVMSMQRGSDVKAVFDRLIRGIFAVEESVRAESGKGFMHDRRYGFIRSSLTNLGTGMRASVRVILPGWYNEGLYGLQMRCEELGVYPRGTRGESGGVDPVTFDISNKYIIGYSEVEIIQNLIDSVNTLIKEDRLQMEHQNGAIIQ